MMIMTIKVTHPIAVADRIIQAGETITAPVNDAQEWIDNGWAVEIVEKIDKKPSSDKAVKHGNG